MKSPLQYPRRIDEGIPLSYYLCLCAVLAVLYGAYMHLAREGQAWYENPEYVMWRYNMDTLTAGREQALRLLAVGDSTLKAGLIPAQLGEGVENLALGGSTPVVGYWTLRDYLAHNPAPEKLIISYTPHHLMAQDAFWERAVRYRYATPDEIRAAIKRARDLDDPVLGDNRFWKYRFNPATYAAPMLRGLRQTRYRNFAGEYQTLVNDRGHHYFGTGERARRGNAETRYEGFAPTPLLDHYLRELIRLSVDAGIETYWLTQPMPQLSCDKLAGGFMDSFSAYLQALATLGARVDKGIPCWDNALYGDAAHLYAGSPRFTGTIGSFVGLER